MTEARDERIDRLLLWAPTALGGLVIAVGGFFATGFVDDVKVEIGELSKAVGELTTQVAVQAERDAQIANLRDSIARLEARMEKHKDGHPFNVSELVRAIEARVNNLEYQAGVKGK